MNVYSKIGHDAISPPRVSSASFSPPFSPSTPLYILLTDSIWKALMFGNMYIVGSVSNDSLPWGIVCDREFFFGRLQYAKSHSCENPARTPTHILFYPDFLASAWSPIPAFRNC